MYQLFPMDPSIFQVALGLFNKVAVILFQLVSAVFIVRTVILLIKISSPAEYGELITNLFMYFALVLGFPIVAELTLSSIAGVAEKIAYLPNNPEELSIAGVFEKIAPDLLIFKLYPNLFELSILSLVQSVYTLFIAFLISLGPVFIFISTLVGASNGLQAYFSSLVAFSMWPVTWSLIGRLSHEVISQTNSSILFNLIFFIVTLVFQALSPFFTYSIIKSSSVGGAASSLSNIARKLCL
jgi:hypothetical protein